MAPKNQTKLIETDLQRQPNIQEEVKKTRQFLKKKEQEAEKKKREDKTQALIDSLDKYKLSNIPDEITTKEKEQEDTATKITKKLIAKQNAEELKKQEKENKRIKSTNKQPSEKNIKSAKQNTPTEAFQNDLDKIKIRLKQINDEKKIEDKKKEIKEKETNLEKVAEEAKKKIDKQKGNTDTKKIKNLEKLELDKTNRTLDEIEKENNSLANLEKVAEEAKKKIDKQKGNTYTEKIKNLEKLESKVADQKLNEIKKKLERNKIYKTTFKELAEKLYTAKNNAFFGLLSQERISLIPPEYNVFPQKMLKVKYVPSKLVDNVYNEVVENDIYYILRNPKTKEIKRNAETGEIDYANPIAVITYGFDTVENEFERMLKSLSSSKDKKKKKGKMKGGKGSKKNKKKKRKGETTPKKGGNDLDDEEEKNPEKEIFMKYFENFGEIVDTIVADFDYYPGEKSKKESIYRNLNIYHLNGDEDNGNFNGEERYIIADDKGTYLRNATISDILSEGFRTVDEVIANNLYSGQSPVETEQKKTEGDDFDYEEKTEEEIENEVKNEIQEEKQIREKKEEEEEEEERQTLPEINKTDVGENKEFENIKKTFEDLKKDIDTFYESEKEGVFKDLESFRNEMKTIEDIKNEIENNKKVLDEYDKKKIEKSILSLITKIGIFKTRQSEIYAQYTTSLNNYNKNTTTINQGGNKTKIEKKKNIQEINSKRENQKKSLILTENIQNKIKEIDIIYSSINVSINYLIGIIDDLSVINDIISQLKKETDEELKKVENISNMETSIKKGEDTELSNKIKKLEEQIANLITEFTDYKQNVQNTLNYQQTINLSMTKPENIKKWMEFMLDELTSKRKKSYPELYNASQKATEIFAIEDDTYKKSQIKTIKNVEKKEEGKGKKEEIPMTSFENMRLMQELIEIMKPKVVSGTIFTKMENLPVVVTTQNIDTYLDGISTELNKPKVTFDFDEPTILKIKEKLLQFDFTTMNTKYQQILIKLLMKICEYKADKHNEEISKNIDETIKTLTSTELTTLKTTKSGNLTEQINVILNLLIKTDENANQVKKIKSSETNTEPDYNKDLIQIINRINTPEINKDIITQIEQIPFSDVYKNIILKLLQIIKEKTSQPDNNLNNENEKNTFENPEIPEELKKDENFKKLLESVVTTNDTKARILDIINFFINKQNELNKEKNKLNKAENKLIEEKNKLNEEIIKLNEVIREFTPTLNTDAFYLTDTNLKGIYKPIVEFLESENKYNIKTNKLELFNKLNLYIENINHETDINKGNKLKNILLEIITNGTINTENFNERGYIDPINYYYLRLKDKLEALCLKANLIKDVQSTNNDNNNDNNDKDNNKIVTDVCKNNKFNVKFSFYKPISNIIQQIKEETLKPVTQNNN